MKKICKVIAIIVMAMLGAVALAEETARVTFDITHVVLSVLGVAFEVLVYVVYKNIVPAVKKWLDAKTTAEQQAMIYGIVKQCVLAAEQLIGEGYGADKRKYVVDALNSKGIDIDFEMIEAAVKEMNDRSLKGLEKVLIPPEVTMPEDADDDLK